MTRGTNGGIFRKLLLTIMVVAGFSTMSFPANSEELRAETAVSSKEVFAGESFRFQIQVYGSDDPEEPDISGITDFTVETLGRQQNNSSFATIINGKLSQSVSRGCILNYKLTPMKAGSFMIPSITVSAEGKTARTNPLTISVKKPEETDDFKLRMSLSKTSCYEGEPVTLTVTWYIGKDVQRFNATLPVLENTEAFQFADAKNVREDYRIPLKGGEVAGQKGRGQMNGREYATITFQKVLIPVKPGSVEIEPATIACEALAGYRRTRDPFDSMFDDEFFSGFFSDDFFKSRQGVYKNVAVPSNGLKLDVLELPKDGRPANFAGHVGEYRVDTMAKPAEVSVGDPITLTVVVSGPEYLDHVDLPNLDADEAFARDFKIPSEHADGVANGGAKTFTQTIRAKHAGVKEIPPVRLAYFDTRQGKYLVAESDPIPLSVRATRIVTAGDAEGSGPAGSAGQAPEALAGGIAANYEDPSVAGDAMYGPAVWSDSPLWLGIIFVPPMMYLAFLAGIAVRARRRANEHGIRSRRACTVLLKELKKIRGKDDGHSLLLDSLRKYLGNRFSLPSGSLTFDDVVSELRLKNTDERIISSLRDVFEACEAGRYAGGSAGIPERELAHRIRTVVAEMERVLR